MKRLFFTIAIVLEMLLTFSAFAVETPGDAGDLNTTRTNNHETKSSKKTEKKKPVNKEKSDRSGSQNSHKPTEPSLQTGHSGNTNTISDGQTDIPNADITKEKTDEKEIIESNKKEEVNNSTVPSKPVDTPKVESKAVPNLSEQKEEKTPNNGFMPILSVILIVLGVGLFLFVIISNRRYTGKDNFKSKYSKNKHMVAKSNYYKKIK